MPHTPPGVDYAWVDLTTLDESALGAHTAALDADLAIAHLALEDARAGYLALAERRRAVHEEKIRRRLHGRTPAEMWTDHDLAAAVLTSAYSGGAGNRDADRFLKTAIEDLAPDRFYEYSWYGFGDEPDPRALPRLKLHYRQDIADVHAAILTMLPALAVDGVLHLDVFEHDLGERGRFWVLVRSAQDAELLRNGSTVATGTLTDILTQVARDHWYEGGPSRYDEDERW